MRPIDVFRGSDSRSTAADNTSAFNCRFAVAPGPEALVDARVRRGDRHQHGREPVHPERRVSPANAKAYADRANVRPGMAVEGGVLVRAFARVGWGWGGRWAGSPDYQHFSTNGR